MPTGTTEGSPAPGPAQSQITVLRNTFFLFIAQVFLKGLGFLAVVLLANHFGVDGFGTYNFVVALATLFVPLADAGVDTYLVRELAAHPERMPTAVGTALRIKSAFSGLALAVIILAYVIFPKEAVGLDIVALGACAVIMRVFPGTISAIFRGRQLMGTDSGVQILGKLIETVVIAVGIVIGVSLRGLLVLLVVGSIVHVALAGMLAIRHGFFRGLAFDVGSARQLIAGGLPFTATGISVAVVFHVDAVLLTYLVGESATGIYRSATTLMFAASGLSSAIVLALFPMIAESFVNRRDEAVRAAKNALSYSLLLALPMAVGGSVLAHQTIQAVYRSTFSDAGPLLAILVWWLPLSFVNNVLGHALGAVGQQTHVLKVTVINAFVNILLNLALIPTYGAMGAAWATVATELLGLVVIRTMVVRTFGPVFDRSRMVRIVLASMSLLVLLPTREHFGLGLLLPIGLVVFAAAAFVTKAVTLSELRVLLGMFRSRSAVASSS